jgi:hypothetical protein
MHFEKIEKGYYGDWRTDEKGGTREFATCADTGETKLCSLSESEKMVSERTGGHI